MNGVRFNGYLLGLSVREKKGRGWNLEMLSNEFLGHLLGDCGFDVAACFL